MRLVAAAIAIALLAAALWMERKATSCGAGLVETRLPHSLRAQWFNGGLWLTDAEGWGVIAPPGKLELSDGMVVQVDRIERYTQEHGFVVEVTLGSGAKALVSFAGTTGSPLRPKLVEPGQQDGTDVSRGASSWTSVGPSSCLYGRFGVARALIGAGILVLMSVGWWASGRKPTRAET